MRLLVTRPWKEAETLAQILNARGHVAIVAPVMEVRFREGPPLALEGVQAVLATSANGMRALAARTTRRDLTVYAVGPQTSKAASDAGFNRVESAGGDASALVRLIAARADPGKGALLHAAGADTAGRVSEALSALGFAVETEVLYGAHPVEALPAPAARALAEATLDGVLLFSPRSASAFAALVAAANLAPACARPTAFCISAATASALAPLTFSRVAVATAPNQEAMLALLPRPTPDP